MPRLRLTVLAHVRERSLLSSRRISVRAPSLAGLAVLRLPAGPLCLLHHRVVSVRSLVDHGPPRAASAILHRPLP